MHQISNDFADCTLVNLDPASPQRGPFAVCQKGVDPNDTSLEERLFILMPDGTWIDEISHSTLPLETRLESAFPDAGSAMRLLGSLPHKAKLKRLEVTPEQVREFIARWQTGPQGGSLQHFLQAWREKHPA